METGTKMGARRIHPSSYQVSYGAAYLGGKIEIQKVQSVKICIFPILTGLKCPSVLKFCSYLTMASCLTIAQAYLNSL